MKLLISNICPFCNQCTLNIKQHVKYHWQGTVQHTIALSHMECDSCGAYITTPEQSRINKTSILAIKTAFPTTSIL